MRTISPAAAALISAGALTAASAVALAAPPVIQEHTGPNGLTVLVAENHSLPLVTIEIAAKNGSMTEPPDYNGLSHLYEHMFFKANQALPNQTAYMTRARELGMAWNGTTGTERVNYFFTTTTDHLKDAMVFMRDAIVTPVFDQKELDREKEVVVGEIDRNDASPNYHFWHEVEGKLFYKYPSRKNPLGDRKTVREATVKKMRTIQERYYVPNNSVLVITGDVKAADIFAQTDALYTGWKRAEDPFKKYPLVKHPALTKSEVVLVEQPVGSVTGEIVFHGPSTTPKEIDFSYAADVLGHALNEPSSRFQKALVDSGKCVRASLSWYTQQNSGPINVGFEATRDKADECVKAVREELPKIKAGDYLSDEEMANAAHELEIEQLSAREKPSAFASVLTFWWASASLDYYLHYPERVKKASRADIARFLDTYVYGKPFIFGAMVSPEMAQKGLDKNHFEELLGLPKSKAAPKGAAPKPPLGAQAGKKGGKQ